MKPKELRELYNLARDASRFTYSPYSKFPVGAAVKTKKGAIYTGSNVENASYSLTICAERVAICNAIAAGDKEIEFIAIYAKKKEVSPCGACRQFILEFGPDIKVIFMNKGKLITSSIRSLMPFSFSL